MFLQAKGADDSIGISPDIFAAGMEQAMHGFPEIRKLAYHTKAVLNTGGHRFRKKLRIVKKFRKKYGFRQVPVRLLEKDQVLQIGGQVYAHEPEYSNIMNAIRSNSNFRNVI